MALIPRYAYLQSQDLKTISAYDITGLYTISTPNNYGNPSGMPNPLPVDFIDAQGYVYFPDVTTLLPNMTVFVLNNTVADYSVVNYPTLPTLSTIPYDYTSLAVLGEDIVYPDGVYRFTEYQTTATGGRGLEYVTDSYIPIFGTVLCCIDNKIMNQDFVEGDCDSCNKKLIKLLKAKAGLDQLTAISRQTGGLSNAEQCGLINKMAEIILFAQSVCNDDCGTCSTCGC